MNQSIIATKPRVYSQILNKSNEIGFSMPSDIFIGSLLKSLISSKLNSNILELGTGMGLSLSWMVEGLDDNSTITSVDNDPDLINIVNDFFDNDNRVNLICQDGSDWIKEYDGEKFDLIFADAWPGKYSDIELTLDLIKVGGFYVIDDMKYNDNWPEGHKEKVDQLITYLDKREDFSLTKMDWSTGIILMTKKC